MLRQKQNNKAVHLTSEQQRALRLLKEALDDVSPTIKVKDILEYSQTEHYAWRHWAESNGQTKEPSSAWAIFREDLPHDVILKMQANFFAGASWTEVSLLPISLLFLNAWRWRLGQEDADNLFNIKSQAEYKEAVDYFTFRQLRNFLLLLPAALYETWDTPFHESIEGLIEQEIKPYFRKRWKALGIPANIALFPEVQKEMEQAAKHRKEIRQKWIGKTHGGFRWENKSFAQRQDFQAIIEFINKAHPLWEHITVFFEDKHYDGDCVQEIKRDEKYKALSDGLNVPDELLKKVFGRKSNSGAELEPLGFAIAHAKKEFEFAESSSTVRRHYQRVNRVSNS